MVCLKIICYSLCYIGFDIYYFFLFHLFFFFFLRVRRPPESTQSRSSAASDVYKRQNRFAEEDAKRKAHQQALQAVIKKSFELRKEKKFDEYKKLIEENAERFADDGWFASTVAEVQAGKAWKEKDYQMSLIHI